MNDKLDGMSKDIEAANLEKLKSLFPECVSEGKLDIDKLLSLCGEYIDNDFEKYKFEWKGKADCLRLAQRRSTGTLRPCEEESAGRDGTPGKFDSDNLYIEGDNLEVLKLLQTAYYRKVKMIYIDPPYNTGNDFVYEDDFADPIARYKEVTSQTTKSNPETMGRYHTNWLNMMYPRLRLAANLLRDDGVIFISIDDNEVDNLKKVCNEVFGEENFVAQIPWRKRTAKSDVPFGISQDYEWILCFARSEEFIACLEGGTRKYFETDDLPGRPWRIHDLTTQRSAQERPNSYFTMINPKTGKEYPANPIRTWAVTKETFEQYYADNRIVFPDDYDFLEITKPAFRYFKDDDMVKAGDKFGFVPVSTRLPDEIGMTQDGTKEIVNIFENKVFGYPKPIALLKYLIKSVTAAKPENDDIILDFFSGSATTAHAVMQLNAEDGGNRKFIMVQLPELCDEKSEAYKAGYKNICEIGKERIRRAGKKIYDEKFPSVGGVSPKATGWFRDTDNYMSLPYNPQLKERAKELRKAGNLSEVLLWQQIHNKLFNGLDFDRQKIIGDYIVDFYCASKNTVIEIDGDSHNEKYDYDRERDEFLEELGLTVIHVQDADVKKNLSGVMGMLNHHPALTGTPPQEGNKMGTNPFERGLDIGFKVLKLDTSNLAEWDSAPIPERNILSLVNRMNKMIDAVKNDRSEEDVIYEIMLKMGVTLITPISKVDVNGKTAYAVGDFLLLICLEKDVTAEDVETLCDYAPGKIVMADSCFADSVVMSNAYYILKDHNIELKLV